MIAVFADDFTGAAEVAAIGRRYGLSAEVHTTFQAPAAADLVVVDTHTRSGTRDDAARRIGEEARRLRDAGIECIYKKVDSVLRGHVVAELARLLEVQDRRRAVLVPANPSFGQVIERGHYSIDGAPLHRTRFAVDPEHPAATSDVLELLGRRDGVRLSYREDGWDFPDSGIIVTGGRSHDELLALARRVDGQTLAAGAAEFFDAVLQLRFGRERERPPAQASAPPSGKTLFVLGSITRPSRMLIAHARDRGVPVVPMPPALYGASADVEATVRAWADVVLDHLEAHERVVIAVDAARPAPAHRLPVDLLPGHLADLTRAVLCRSTGNLQLFVGGGTTASIVVRRLGWRALRVSGELDRGVVTLAVADRPGQSITVKPGNYLWPEAIVRGFE